VRATQLAGAIENRLQRLDRGDEGLDLPGEAMLAQQAGGFAREGKIAEIDAGAVKAGFRDHADLLFQRPFLPVGPAALHGPERLEDEQFLHG
jgi:hypothetical protein